jgi:outer membrane lipoprotein-sorting protein
LLAIRVQVFTAAAASDTIGAWLARQAELRTWSADFTQTRTLKTLTQPLVTHGQAWFASPDRFRWELGLPPQTVAIRQPDQMMVIYPVLKRAERYPLTAVGGQWSSALALLEAGFPRTRADFDAKFKLVKETSTEDSTILELEPRSAGARKLIPRLEVILGRDFSLRATLLQFADGSSLRTEFSNPQLNLDLDQALFVPKLGPEFKVVEPLKK